MDKNCFPGSTRVILDAQNRDASCRKIRRAIQESAQNDPSTPSAARRLALKEIENQSVIVERNARKLLDAGCLPSVDLLDVPGLPIDSRRVCPQLIRYTTWQPPS